MAKECDQDSVTMNVLKTFLLLPRSETGTLCRTHVFVLSSKTMTLKQRKFSEFGDSENGEQVEVLCVLNPRPLPSEEARRLREHRQRQTRRIGSTWQRGSGEQVTKIEKSLLNSSLLCDPKFLKHSQCGKVRRTRE